MNLRHALISRFSRITTGAEYIAQLDGLRTLAFSLVFMIHLNHQASAQFNKQTGLEGGSDSWHRVIETGEYGLPLFFAISGFILGLPFARAALGLAKPVSLKRFYLRRLTRLEPPLIINVIFLYALLVLARNGSARELFPHAVATITYVHNLVFGADSVINTVTWSLEVEVQFYLLTPFLTLLFRIPRRSLRQLTFCSIALACVYFDNYFPHSFLLAQLEYFMMGFLAIDLYLSLGKSKVFRSYAWDLLGILVWPAMVFVACWQNQFSEIRFLLPFLILGSIYSSFRGRVLQKMLRCSPMTAIGGMSYTCYLYHFVLIAVLVRVLGSFLPLSNYYSYYAVSLLLIYPICIIVCAFIFLVCERPFMYSDWPQRIATALRNRGQKPVA